MKVLQMGPYPPPHGGVQTNLVAIRRYLLARGIPSPVINLTRYRREQGGGIYYPKTFWGVIRLLFTVDCDVIHFHVGGDLTLRHAGLILICFLIHGKKTVFTFHSGGYPSSEAGRRAHRLSLRGFALRRLGGLIAVNQELVELFQKFGVPTDRIRLIVPFVGETPIGNRPLPEMIDNFYRGHEPVLVTVSGLEPEYDLPLQIEAVGRLREQFPRMGLVIVGGGSQEAQISSLITAKPYAEHILLCGDIPHGTTLQAMRVSRLFLRTTLYDGDSISVREALHLGVPVIATDNGMRPPGVHLVPKSDVPALCRAVENVLRKASGPAAACDTGEENLEAVLRFYHWVGGCSSRSEAQ